MGVQELLPAPLAGLNQRLRRGKGQDELPSEGIGPVVKGFQRRRIVFQQGLLELVDQGGALLDQHHLVPAEQPQLLGQGIHGLQCLPAVTVHTQSIGQGPGIQVIGLGAAGRFALAVALGRYRMHRVNGVAPLQELIDRSSLAGFDGHRQVGPGRGLLDKALPAFQRVLEFKVRHDASLAVDDHHSMVVFGPIEAGVMREVLP